MVRQIIEDYPMNLLDEVAGLGDEDKWDYPIPSDINSSIEYALGMLTERESNVIQMRYKYGLTLSDVAKEYGNITRERVRQVEAKAIRKLRHPSRKCWLVHGVSGMIANARNEAKNSAISSELKNTIAEISSISVSLAKITGEALVKTSMDDIVDKDPILNQSIQELNLSVRSYNCLDRAHIKTVKDIVNMTTSELFRVRNLGKKSCDEIL